MCSISLLRAFIFPLPLTLTQAITHMKKQPITHMRTLLLHIHVPFVNSRLSNFQTKLHNILQLFKDESPCIINMNIYLLYIILCEVLIYAYISQKILDHCCQQMPPIILVESSRREIPANMYWHHKMLPVCISYILFSLNFQNVLKLTAVNISVVSVKYR